MANSVQEMRAKRPGSTRRIRTKPSKAKAFKTRPTNKSFEHTRHKVSLCQDIGELSDQDLAREMVSEGLGPCYVPKVLPGVDVRYARSMWHVFHPDTSPPRGVPIRLTEEAILVWDSPRRDKAMWALMEYEARRKAGVSSAESILAVYRNGLADAEVQAMRPWNINELFALCTAFEEKTVVLENCSRCGHQWFQHASVADTHLICEYCSLYALGGSY